MQKTQIFQGFYPAESSPGHRHVIMSETPAHSLQLRKLDICSKTDISKTAWIKMLDLSEEKL